MDSGYFIARKAKSLGDLWGKREGGKKGSRRELEFTDKQSKL